MISVVFKNLWPAERRVFCWRQSTLNRRIAVTALVLALGLIPPFLLSANPHMNIVATPTTIHVDPNNGPTAATVYSFCSYTPCSFTYVQVWSNSNVGSLSNVTGPVSVFNAGAELGTVRITVYDNFGNQSPPITVTVVP